MLNALGYATKQAVGRCNGTSRTVSIKADIDTLPNIPKTSDTRLDFHLMTEGIEIEADWPAKATPRTGEI
jgi:uncharacterized protein (DUF736 family)